MAEQAEREDDEDLELEPEALEPEEPEEVEEGPEEPEEAGEVLEVSFGDEAAPASNEERDSGLVRKLRAEIRDRDARLATLQKGEQPQKIEVGDKPTLETCDYDEAKFETDLDAWKDRKAKAEQADADALKTQDATRAAWAEELADFGRKKTALRAPDFNAAEEEVVSTLSQVQQAVVIKAAEDSAKVIYALGKHPAKLATLAAIEDPIKFAVAVAKLEGTLKVTQRRKAPEVDTPVRGSAPLSKASDKHLERLEADADRTGDRTKVVQYKRSLKQKARA